MLGGMDADGDNEGGGESGETIIGVPPRREIPHYYGNNVRVLFVVSAVVLIIAQSTGAELPMSTTTAVISAVILVIVAGITNPVQGWIHWANEFIAMFGVLLFGTSAIDHYRAGLGFFDPSFAYIETLALLSLLALYFATRTVRGFHLRPIHHR